MSQLGPAFRSALGTALRSPMHLTLVVAVGGAATLAALVVPFVPLIGLVASPVVVAVLLAPLAAAAFLGSARAVRDGENAFGGARTAVTQHGPDLVGAYGIVALGCLLVGGSVGVVVFLGAGGVRWLLEPRTLLTGVDAVLVALPFVATVALGLLVTVVLQFAAPAAVVAGTGPVDSLRTALRFAVANPLGVVGFSLLGLVVCVVASLPALGLAAAVYYFGGVGPAVVVLLIGYVEAAAVSGAVVSVFLVAYFEAAADDSVLPAGHRLDGVGDTGSFEFVSEKRETERLGGR